MALPPSVWPRRKATRVSVRVIHVQVEDGWEGEGTGKSEGLRARLSVSVSMSMSVSVSVRVRVGLISVIPRGIP